MHGEVLHHLVRRGFEAVSINESGQTVVAEIDPLELLPIGLTVALFVFILASVRRLQPKEGRHVTNMITGQIHYWRSCRQSGHD